MARFSREDSGELPKRFVFLRIILKDKELKKICVVGEQLDSGLRLDRALAGLTGLSRVRIQTLFDQGLITVDGMPLTRRARVTPEQTITVLLPEPKPLDLKPEALDLDILFEDEDLIVVNKRPGQVVHPGAGRREETLVHALLHHCRGSLSGIGGVERPGIVHRLDKDTSGLLLVAKNDFAHLRLSEQFRMRQIEKYYHAFVLRAPPSLAGSWQGSIGRHPVRRKQMTVLRQGGRSARTDYRILERFDKTCFLELRLHTGRTHQIRVHAAHAKCPVVGDAVYGGQNAWTQTSGVVRQLLHARRVVLEHPRHGTSLDLVAPPPADFDSFKKWLQRIAE